MRTPRALLAACTLLASCRSPAPAVHQAHAVDLIPSYGRADVRADSIDFDFVLDRGELDERDWTREDGPAGPVLWMRRRAAGVTLPSYSVTEKELSFTAAAHPELRQGVVFTVVVNTRPVGTSRAMPEARRFDYRIPSGLLTAPSVALRIDAAESPRGRRSLAISRMELRQPSRGDRVASPRREGVRLWLPPNASIAFDLRAPGAPGQLQLTAAAGPSGPGAVVATVDEGGGPRELPAVDTGAPAALDLGIARDRLFRLSLRARDHGVWIERLALVGPATIPTRPQPSKPNVIVYLTDTLRADHLGAYGYRMATSPRFDAFVREGVLFENAMAQSSWTRPTVATIFTGMGVDAHGVGGLGNMLSSEFTTMAEAIGAAGWRTAGFVSNGIVNETLQFHQGFGTWDSSTLHTRPARDVVARGLEWIDEGKAPFLLYLHTLEPHTPYIPEEAHWSPFRPAGYRGSRDVAALTNRKDLDADELRYLLAAYDGEVHQNDAAFGALLDGLRQRGLLENTIVVFTADHGEEFRDHGGSGHGGTLYQEVLHIPLAVRMPGQRRGARVSEPVQQADILPTLLSFLGITPLPGIEGRDLWRQWLGQTVDEPTTGIVSRLEYAPADKVAVRSGSLQLVLNQEPDAPVPAELYDLAGDGGQRTNLAAQRPIAVAALTDEAAVRREQQHATRRRFKAGVKVEPTPEERERLRALGYVQ